MEDIASIRVPDSVRYSYTALLDHRRSHHIRWGGIPNVSAPVYRSPNGRGFHIERVVFEAGTGQVQGIDRFFGQVDSGGLPRAVVEESITRLATEIAPAVR